MKKDGVFAVILAGGRSSRLFPFNKVLSDLTGSGRSLIQDAYRRARLLCKDQVHVLTVRDMVAPVKRQLKIPAGRFFVDPAQRGTWPALLWAMAHLRRKNPEAVLAVITGDHVIPRLPAFARAAKQACAWAAQEPAVVMLGVEPGADPAEWTGYGIFRVAGKNVTAFQEKPSLAEAERLICEKGYQWNSGMFFFRIAVAEELLKRDQPAMAALYEKLCMAIAVRKMSEARALYAEFPAKIPHPLDSSRQVDNTIDFAIMTPLVRRTEGSEVTALAVTGGLPQWTDLGQWEALCAVIKKDKRDNVRLGRVQLDRATQRCILASDGGYRLEVKGLTDAVVALSARGLLVLPRTDLARIKECVAAAPAQRFLQVNTLPGTQIKRTGRRVVVSRAPFIG